ncbi:MAG: heparinase II/III family protein [Verrucomicrobiaceae bacterium]|nr:heparinase II/III family protein [Verrucomicrobiaceae bacterium]
MKPNSRSASLFAVFLAARFVHGQLADEFHVWTNTAGKQVEATLVSVDATARTVKIKTKDGREFDVPIASLSAADFEYAKTRYAAMKAAPPAAPAVAMPAAPAAPGTPATTPAPAPAKGKAAAAAPKKPAPPRPAFTVLPVARFKAPAANDYLGGIQKVRPRMIQNAAGWAAIKGQIAADPVLAKMMENLKASGEDLLKDPELNRINGEIRGTVSEGSKAIYRMGLLAALHYGDGDLKWAERAARELILLCDKSNFRDWHPSEAQAVADMVIAVSLGYDWFHASLNAQQKTDIRTFVTEKGIDALVAHLNEDEIPPTAFGTAPGATATKKAPPKAAPKKADKVEIPVTAEQMASAAALLIAAVSFADEDIDLAKKAAGTGAKIFGEGVQRFAPAGVWPEGMAAGDAVMDYVAMVVQSLRSATGKDLGLTMLEGIPQFGMARMHLYGPTGQPFNFGDSAANAGTRAWVATWLSGLHGNPGIAAVTAGAKMPVGSSYFGHAGHFMYYNPHAAGDGTPDSPEFAMPGGIAATVRTGWEKTDMFVAVKGGDNNDLHAQLDIGSFVLDAGGQRFGLELGMESDRAPGLEVKPGADRTKRFELYLEGTAGQNTITFGENQDQEAKAGILIHASSPAQGVAVVDMTKAYSKDAKDVHRGIMAVRGEAPYIVIQDDLQIKNSKTLTWKMHTKAEIAPEGASAKLTQGGKTLLATIISPKGAAFTVGDPPEPTTEQMRTLGKDKDGRGEGIKILKVDLADAKGPTSLCITFTTAEAAPAHEHKPIAEWVKKK